MAIRLKVQEDKVTLKVGQSEGATLNAVREARPILINDYDDLIDKPSINGVELVGNKTTEDLGIQAGVTSWNGQTGDVTYTTPAAPVQSVNGKTGAVSLDADDVGALPDDTPIPTKTSDLTNDSGFVNATQAASAAPVQSVNGQTGAVTVDDETFVAEYGVTTYADVLAAYNAGKVILAKSGEVIYTLYSFSSNTFEFTSTYTNLSREARLKSDDSWGSSAYLLVPTNRKINNKALSADITLDASDVGALPDDTTFVGSVSVTPDLTSGTKVGSINVDGTSTDLYAPTNTDTKVTQTATTTTDYTYWRGLCVGSSAVQSESGAFSTVTDAVRTFNNIRVQPSTGTIKATAFKGDLTGDVTGDVTGTASGNLKAGDNVSSLTNDSGFVDATGAANAAPVQSVNGDTGAVVLDATDVGALPDTTNYAGSPSVGGSATFANGIHYGRVDDTSTSTAYTATIPGITSYYDGLTIILYNGKVTSASGFTININGLGAYGTYNNMSLGNEHTPTAPTRDTTIFNVNYAMILTYCSDIGGQGITGWICYRGYDANTNTIGYQIRTNSYSLPMTKKVYRYRLLFTSADGEGFVPANTSTSTNATSARTPCQDPIDPFGSIVYYGTTAAVDVGSRPSASYLWQEYTLSLGYSFQKSPNYSLTSWKPVYLKCAPQTDGSAIIDSTDPIVQDLPTTADGFIYIFLGVAYSATSIELNLYHPVYFFKNGVIRLWTNADATPNTEIITPTYTTNSYVAEADIIPYTRIVKQGRMGTLIFRAKNTAAFPTSGSTELCRFTLPKHLDQIHAVGSYQELYFNAPKSYGPQFLMVNVGRVDSTSMEYKLYVYASSYGTGTGTATAYIPFLFEE